MEQDETLLPLGTQSHSILRVREACENAHFIAALEL